MLHLNIPKDDIILSYTQEKVPVDMTVVNLERIIEICSKLAK